MHVSMTEMKAALRRCFEANGYFVGNYEDAANMVLWLEKHGLNGFGELQAAMPYINSDSQKLLSTVIYEDSSSAIIDSHGRSALNCVAAAVDLAHAKALESGIATITVRNCHNRMFVLKAITDCGRRGISAVAYWQNGSSVITEHTAAIQAGERYPAYSEATTALTPHQDDDEHQSLTIICSSRIDLSSSLQHSKGNRHARYIDSRQIKLNKEYAVDTGFEIDPALWNEISNVGANVLVESSEQSRMGAGA